MYNLEEGIIELEGKREPIEKFEVWFQVAQFGVTSNIEVARQRCKDSDFDPQFCIIPVPVAKSATLYELLVK